MSSSVAETAKVVAEYVKRNGELDKCKREVLNKVVNSNYMKNYIDECNKFIKEAIQTYPHNGDISRMREFVRNEIRRKHAYSSVVGYSDRLMRENESLSKLNDMTEEIARSELGLPPRDSNIELVDMEVSSGKSSCSSSSTTISSKYSEKSEKSSKSFKGDDKPPNHERPPIVEEVEKSPSPCSISRSPSPISDDSLPPYEGDNNKFGTSEASRQAAG